MGVSSVEDLDVFKRLYRLTLKLYEHTKQFPSDEKYGLISQIRRASSSVCANLMDGSHRNNMGEYRQFVGISRGSVVELKYHLLLAKDLNYINIEDFEIIYNEINAISKMLHGLLQSLAHTQTHTNRREIK